jgi:NAD(P)-dependent dehydrogenase (short-subunit alcohol dehydrogenase family)
MPELRPAGRQCLPGRSGSRRSQKVADRINAAGNGKAIAVKMDVTKREDNAGSRGRNGGGLRLDQCRLFNAGLNKPRFFMDIDEDNWDMIMNVNTKAMWLGCRKPPAR